MNDIRVGYGYDVHQLAESLPLWIGGIKIEHTKGCVAHSDGYVLIHAICDAILGAANMRDIGFHFPDNDNNYKGIDIKILLKETFKLISDKWYKIGNIDSTVAMQRPKLKDYISLMQQTLADVMNVDVDRVSIKATTTEKLGFEGDESGVSASAVALIYK